MHDHSSSVIQYIAISLIIFSLLSIGLTIGTLYSIPVNKNPQDYTLSLVNSPSPTKINLLEHINDNSSNPDNTSNPKNTDKSSNNDSNNNDDSSNQSKTPTPSTTNTQSITPTDSSGATSTPTDTLNETQTPTSTTSFTETPTNIPTDTQGETPTPTNTINNTDTPTNAQTETPTPTQEPPKNDNKMTHLHVSSDGKYILNTDNQPIVFHGINIDFAVNIDFKGGRHWTMPEPDKYIDKNAKLINGTKNIYDILKDQGFNVVRLALYWQNLEPNKPIGNSRNYDSLYLSDYDHMVKELTDRGIGVIIDIHQAFWSPAFTHAADSGCALGTGLPAWLYPNACKTSDAGSCLTVMHAKYNFFNRLDNAADYLKQTEGFLARRYATNPLVIGYDMINEPNYREFPNCNDPKIDPNQKSYTKIADLTPFYNDIGSEIQKEYRALNMPEPLYIYEQGNFPKQADVTTRPNLTNPVMEFHLYNSPLSSIQTTIDNAVNKSTRLNSPLYLGEFSNYFYPNEGTGDADAVWKSLSDKKIGWTYYAGTNCCLYTLIKYDYNSRNLITNTQLINYLQSKAWYTY